MNMKELVDEVRKDYPLAAGVFVLLILPMTIGAGFLVAIWSTWWLLPVWNALPFPDLTFGQFYTFDVLVGVMTLHLRPKETEGVVSHWVGVLISTPILYALCMWMMS